MVWLYQVCGVVAFGVCCGGVFGVVWWCALCWCVGVQWCLWSRGGVVVCSVVCGVLCVVFSSACDGGVWCGDVRCDGVPCE